MTTAVTGHRPDKTGGYGDAAFFHLVGFAQEILDELKPTVVITGMALGWDTAVAQACVNLGSPFIAAIPFKGQEDLWPHTDKERYRKLIAQSFSHHYICDPGYAPIKLQKRNMWMVDQLKAPEDCLLALYNGSAGGTHNCIQYAKKKRTVHIFNAWTKWQLYNKA